MEGKFKSNYILIPAIIILLFALWFSINRNSNLKTDLNISNQNQKALTDSVRISKNYAGQLEYSKNILVSSNTDLAKLNENLASELKKQKGKVFELSKTIATIKDKPNDTIYLPSKLITYKDDINGIAWKYDTIFDKHNFRYLEGISKFKLSYNDSGYDVIPLTTKLTNFKIGFDFIQGLRETNNGDVEMFVRSNHPSFEVNDLNAVIINPDSHPVLKKFTNEKRFGIGLNAGYGLYIDNFNNKAGLGGYLGIGLNYSLFRF